MLNFLRENIGTICTAIVVFGTAALIVRKMIKDKKSGKTSCSCGCSGCSPDKNCHCDK